MKIKFYVSSVLFLFIFTSCQWVEFNEEVETKEEENFIEWVNKLTYEEANSYYEETANIFLKDARLCENIIPFFIKDVVTHHSSQMYESDDYHYTNDEGITYVYYNDSIIFNNTWGVPYMSSSNMMTMVDYGKLHNMKIILIKNNSTFLPDENHDYKYYAYEKKFFAEINGGLHEYSLREMGVSYGIWEVKSAEMEGVVLIKSTDFVRYYPRSMHITVIHLPSKRFKTFSETLD